MAYLIGITGQIASGKSYVSNILREHFKYLVFDADAIVKKFYNDEKVKKQILKIFPHALTADNQLNKYEIAKQVFNERQKKMQLQKIFHPIIKSELLKFHSKNQRHKLLFAEVPLLFEANLHIYCNYVICAYVHEELRRKRFEIRSSKYKSFFNKISNNQLSNIKKLCLSDFAIYTINNKPQIINQILQILNKLQ